SSTHLWRVFDLGKLVQRVAEELASLNAGFEIDPDEVILAGHSGAGCDGSNGLYKVAKEHGEFKDKDGGTHQLRALGFADTYANVERTIYAHEQEWIAAGAIASPWPKKGQKNSGWADHYAMPLVWTFWALQRFCAARAEDREILNQQRNGQPADHHGDDDPAR